MATLKRNQKSPSRGQKKYLRKTGRSAAKASVTGNLVFGRVGKVKKAPSVKLQTPLSKQGSSIKSGRISPRKAFSLGKQNRNKQVRIIAVASGNLVELRQKAGLSQGELARITGYAMRSIAGWESGKVLSAPAIQKLTETNRLFDALRGILPDMMLQKWLKEPNPAFEGQTPMQIIERGESDRIWRMIYQIDANVAN